MTAYLTRLSGSRELAEELTQETFYQAVKNIDRFDGRCSVNTWLCSIAKHLYIDTLRRRKPVDPLPEEVPSPDDFAENLVRKDQAMIAHRYLHSLEEPYREVFTLRTFCDLSIRRLRSCLKRARPGPGSPITGPGGCCRKQ